MISFPVEEECSTWLSLLENMAPFVINATFFSIGMILWKNFAKVSHKRFFLISGIIALFWWISNIGSINQVEHLIIFWKSINLFFL